MNSYSVSYILLYVNGMKLLNYMIFCCHPYGLGSFLGNDDIIKNGNP